MKKYFIGSDHAGIPTKQLVVELLKKRGIEVEDVGAYSKEVSVDYPDYAEKVCLKLLENPNSLGVLVCGSGIGMSIGANRFKEIRAALCHDSYTAKMARLHNDANVLCVGDRIVGAGVLESIVEAWCEAEFEGGRHLKRVEKLGCIGG